MQENALIVSLQMFNLILERCATLFPAPSAPVTTIQALGDVAEDLQALLPAIKVRFSPVQMTALPPRRGAAIKQTKP
jgi:hypothetical protein